MKKCKSKLAVALAAVLTLSSVCATTAFADCTDTYWATANEYVRHKDDTSCVYVYNKGSNYVSVSVYGEGSANGRGYVDVSSCPGYNGSYRTTSLTVAPGQRASIHQFIKEKGCSYAHLCVGNVYGPSNGEWSPDSSRKYDEIN